MINKVLKEQLELIRPSEEDINKINKVSQDSIKFIKDSLKKIKAEVFIGGSLAKSTLVKKDIYDIDIFVRFDNSYGDEKISQLLGRVLGKQVKKIHGSRDYYQLKDKGILVEIIPVLKIKKPEDAKNVTDLSYFHVNYVINKIKKNKKLVNEIMLAKSFAHAQYCYGAESYIHGFSGYALELLVCYYGSFLKFIKEIVNLNLKKGKMIVDDAKFYKNKDELLINLNTSKRQGPIILIDPTFRERNASSSLNEDTFYKFQNACKGFLKKPSLKFFEKINIENEFKKFKDVKKIVVKTNKQAGDIAGTKSKKFFDFMTYKLRREFVIIKDGFDYNENENIASFYFVLEKKKDEVIKGPPITAVTNLNNFKKAHSKAFIKKNYAYTKITHKLSFDEWFKKFKEHEKSVIKSMNVVKVEKV
ncbi:MAG: nucleotidyltransferase domain-containing protein [archaeon]